MAVRVVIMGAAGRDFHNFNLFFRDNSDYQVVGFTATQIPNIEGRMYPASLAGSLYPEGIPIFPEEDLDKVISGFQADEVVFAYSDVSHEYVMHKASGVMAAGADFRLMGPNHSMLASDRFVVAVCAARTGSGKSQTTRFVAEHFTKQGLTVAVIRHPMPYGDLEAQKLQRFATLADLDLHQCTIEEREEYEPHIMRGNVLFAGVDYAAILEQAEKEADVILWDGGNNDLPFYRPDLMITVVDPHRPGHELRYHPGETNVRLADVVIINKVDSAEAADVAQVQNNVASINASAEVIHCSSPISVADPAALSGKKVLVVEDGPTLTHGEMSFGAGYLAAKQAGGQIIDPRCAAVGSIANTFEKYPHMGPILPAMGYGDQQIRELETTIENSEADVVVIGTPIDLQRVMKLTKPAVRVTYDLEDASGRLVQRLQSAYDARS